MTTFSNTPPEGGSVETVLRSDLDIVYMRMAFGLAAASGFYRPQEQSPEQVDIPLAAVGTSNGTLVAKGVASDNLLQVDGVDADAHAEGMMIQSFLGRPQREHFPLDTVYTTFEPCRVCLKALHDHLPDLRTIYYGNERAILERKGDVNQRPTVHEYAAQWGITVDIQQFDKDPGVRKIGEKILGSFTRDKTSGIVTIDQFAMAQSALELRQLSE